MITVYPFETLGHANHGWLDARHHFSFAQYYNPRRTGFGNLLVVNDDTIAPGRGFGTHPHDNMEIITYVRQGAITHKDSMGNVGRTEAGDVQVMSAGTGVFHSEYNLEPVETKLYQIWIEPNQQNAAPRWEAKHFPKEPAGDRLSLLASGMKQHSNQQAAFIHADAAIYGGRMKAGSTLTHPITHQAYLLAAQGELLIGDQRMQQGDGAEVISLPNITIKAITDAELLVIDVPNHHA